MDYQYPAMAVKLAAVVSLLSCKAYGQIAIMSKDEQLHSLYIEKLKCEAKMERDSVTLEGVFCNRTWDNLMCWPDTRAGTVNYQPCPAYINGFDQSEYASKVCLENGTWYRMPGAPGPWTNFTVCMRGVVTPISELIKDHMPRVKVMYTIGYSLSLATLLLALAIMTYFRRLHCPRNFIHINVFLAFMLRAAISLMNDILLVENLGFPGDVNRTADGELKFIEEGSHWECKLSFTLFNYIILTSVMWLLNEGLYLQLILTVSVFAEKVKVRWFVLFGWGVPIFFVIPWVILRIHFDDSYCWNMHYVTGLYWVIKGPMVASVLINFIFFINIIRILYVKLSATNGPETGHRRYRRLAKSTLILIPLFAVYYIGFIWVHEEMEDRTELIIIYIEMLFNSFQGFLVAMLFCFFNAEVQNEFRKRWHRYTLRRGSSFRSMRSLGSMFHRNSRQDSRFDSRVTSPSRSHHSPSRTMDDTALVLEGANGHLSAIAEEQTSFREAERFESALEEQEELPKCQEHCSAPNGDLQQHEPMIHLDDVSR